MNYKKALRKAAEEAYKNEITDTEMDILEIKEVIEKNRKLFATEEEWKLVMDNASYENKEEWIEEKIKEWLSNE